MQRCLAVLHKRLLGSAFCTWQMSPLQPCRPTQLVQGGSAIGGECLQHFLKVTVCRRCQGSMSSPEALCPSSHAQTGIAFDIG